MYCRVSLNVPFIDPKAFEYHEEPLETVPECLTAFHFPTHLITFSGDNQGTCPSLCYQIIAVRYNTHPQTLDYMSAVAVFLVTSFISYTFVV